MRQGVAHVARVPVDEVVLAAVRLVGDDDDVAPLGQGRASGGVRLPVPRLIGSEAGGTPVFPGESSGRLFRKEFLDGGEDDAAGRHGEFGAQVGAAVRLDRRLAQQVPAAREGGEQLVVQIVAVGQHHHGRVPHGRLADDAPGVERHRQALARPLRVPDHADAAVARCAARLASRLVAAAGPFAEGLALPLQRGRAQGFGNRDPDRVELVVARHLLDRRVAAGVLEDDEIAH